MGGDNLYKDSERGKIMEQEKTKRGRKSLSARELGRRYEWKELMARTLDENFRPPTDSVVSNMNSILECGGSGQRVTAAQVNHYLGPLPLNSDSKSNEIPPRVPANREIANALVFAFENLKVLSTSNTDEYEQAIRSELVELLGYEFLVRPIPRDPRWRERNEEPGTVDEARKHCSGLMYEAAISELQKIYSDQEEENQKAIICSLEEIAKRYSE